MADPAARLTPRSAAATVDLALMRAARTELGEPETSATMTLADRLRGLAPFRPPRLPGGDSTAAWVGRRGA